MKKTLIGLLAVALSLTAFSCDSPFASLKEGTVVNNNAERKANDAQYNDGDYMFYFTNGNKVHRDIDGYSIYESRYLKLYDWRNNDVKGLNGQLNDAKIDHEQHTTAAGSPKYGWNKFDKSLLTGIGYEKPNGNSTASEVWVETKSHAVRYTKWIDYIHYLPNSNTDWHFVTIGTSKSDASRIESEIKKLKEVSANHTGSLLWMSIAKKSDQGSYRVVRRDINAFLENMKEDNVSILLENDDFMLLDAKNIIFFHCNTENWM